MLPLQAWGIVIGLALLIFGLLGTLKLPNSHQYQHPQQNGYLNFQHRLKNLEAQIQEEPEVFRVISIGSSLVASAVARDSFFNQQFQRTGKPIVAHRIFFPGANYTFLEDPHLLAFLEKVQPDLLCLEDQTFLFQEGKLDMVWPRPFFSDLHHTFVHNLNTLKHLLLPAYFSEPGFDGIVDSTLTFDTDYAMLDSMIAPEDSLDYQITERSIRRKNSIRRFNTLLDDLSEKGTQVAVINLARPAPVEKIHLSEAWKVRRDALVRQYQQSLNLEYWSFPEELPFRYFWDLDHMNGKGRRVYSEWLSGKIAQIYDDRI